MADSNVDTQAATLRVGTSLGEWQLEDVLGTGGMASVYSARSAAGARAAIKVLHKELVSSSDVRSRFALEGTAASRVGHPGVVEVLGSGEAPDGTCYLVLELLEGEPLGRALKRGETLTLPRLLDVLDQVLDVLAAAHASGIVHRDLKPDNLFVGKDGRIKVLDFGIARILDEGTAGHMTRAGIALGTVPFMSPEQALGKRDQVDGRSDLFSLGAMTFRLLSGRNVHLAKTDADVLVAVATKPAPPLLSVAPDAPPALAAIVDVALAFSKDSRYPDAKTMQADVRAVMAGNPPPHATRVQRAREMSTRIDLPAARSVGVPASAAAVSSAASGGAHTRPNPVPPSARPPASQDPSAPTEAGERPVWNAREGAPTVASSVYEAETAPMAMRPALLLDGPTLRSSPPSTGPEPEPPKKTATGTAIMGAAAPAPIPAAPAPPAAAKLAPAPQGRRGALWIGAILLAGASAGAGYLFSEFSAHGAPAPSALPSTPAAPVVEAATAPMVPAAPAPSATTGAASANVPEPEATPHHPVKPVATTTSVAGATAAHPAPTATSSTHPAATATSVPAATATTTAPPAASLSTAKPPASTSGIPEFRPRH